MIRIEDLKPAKAMSDSQQLDKDSIFLLRNILNNHHINDSQLQEGGSQDNTDGYIVLLDAEDRPEGKVWVQVKHLTHPPKKGKAFYDIPGSLIGYAGRFKGDVVIFIACDTKNKTFYWKCIDEPFIDECLKKGIQGTYRYAFQKNESATAASVENTLTRWRQLCQSKVDSIRDERRSLNEFMSLQRAAFNQVPSTFYGVKDSHIKRAEVDVLYNWVVCPLAADDTPVRLLVGEAGVGKSVVIKSLIDKLEANGIKALSIKADRSNITEETTGPLTLQTLRSSLALLASQQDKVVLIVDQIDALSQSLSSDRQKLNVLLDAVSSLKDEASTRTRIIVSCRCYDLIYDSSLKTLGFDNALELGVLSEDEIRNVVDRLSLGLYERLNKQTRGLLRTAQLLDIFCRLYAGGHRKIKYDNEIALFDELWLHLVNDCPERLASSAIEQLLFKVAKTIQESETLSPFWTPSAEEYPSLKYLASEGVIRYERGQVSLFHQSFLDYVSAREYVQSERSFVQDLEAELQGLEIRSTVKLVLEYLRFHSERHYKKTLLELLNSSQIRQHVKLIAVSVMASSKQFTLFERNQVIALHDKDHQLYAAFLNGSSTEWFPPLYGILREDARHLTTESELYNPVAFFLSRNAMSHPEEVVVIVNAIENTDARNNIVYYLLRGDIDYRVDGVKELYRSLIEINPGDSADCVRKAINTDIDFAVNETKKLLYDYLCGRDERRRSHVDHVLVEIVCKKIFEEQPRRFFVMMVECFLDVIMKTSRKTFYWYTTDSVFDRYITHDYQNQLFDWLVESSKREEELVAPYVPKLIDTRSEKALSLAFIIMTGSPAKYTELLKEIVSDEEKLDGYLDYGDFQYYFLELLKAWYPVLSAEDKVWYQERVLAFKSRTDLFANKDRQYSRLLFSSLWRRKWMLLYTIPEGEMIENVRRSKLELRRRFFYDYDNEKPTSGVTVTMGCSGIASSEVYKTFSKKAWLHSFYGVKEHRAWAKKEWLPFDEGIHAKEFSTCVSGNPARFYAFVKSLFLDDKVSDLYRFAGLRGLIEGGRNPEELIPLFRYFKNDGFLSHHSRDFLELAGRFVMIEGMVDEIIDYYHGIIVSCGTEVLSDVKADTMERHVTDMLNHVINTTAGHALEALIELASRKELQEKVYGVLNSICGCVTPEMRLLVLYKVYSKEFFEESLFEQLLDTYLPEMGAELLFVSPALVQQYLYFKTDKVMSYVEKVNADFRAHIILAQVYYYGTCHTSVSDYCRARLEGILEVGEEKTVAKMVEVAYKYISDNYLSTLSKKILMRFANDEREAVRRAYLLHCNVLPVSSFPFFTSISQGWRLGRMHEWHEVLEYVLRCCGMFPIECYNYINQQEILMCRDVWRLEDDLVKVLLAIYKKMKLDDDRDMLEKLMDMFDVLIIRGNSVVMSALETIS